MRQAIALQVSALIFSTGCERPPEDLRTRIDRAVSDAEQYLRSKQQVDGAWRSETYGTLTDGITLTPPLLKTLVMLEGDGAFDDAACRRGAEYLRSWVGDDGAIPQDIVFDFPVYSSALSTIVLSRLPGEPNARARDAWLAELRRHQLDESLGWSPEDVAYGGWGYSVLPPERPDPSSDWRPPFEADLSSTLFAVGAMRLSGVPPDDPVIAKALRFVERCQNFGESEYDDGGFFLSPCVPIQNKGGEAGVDADERTRFHSYGSATADGLRAMLQCGLSPAHPRVVAARQWLERSFTTETNPGTFAPEREQDRDAAYFYWCWSVTHALRRMGIREFEGDGVDVVWPELLAEALLERQQSDGSWRNRFSFVKEDDPLIATAFAAAALANCREMMLEQVPTIRGMLWTVYLAGEIHSDWREQIADGLEAAGLPVELVGPVTDHDASDDCGVAILGAEDKPFWKDHKGAKVNAIRTRTLLERADVVVVRFGDKYRQWNAAFDAGYAAALGKPIITVHSPDHTHALKEVDSAAMAVAESPEQVVQILEYVIDR